MSDRKSAGYTSRCSQCGQHLGKTVEGRAWCSLTCEADWKLFEEQLKQSEHLFLDSAANASPVRRPGETDDQFRRRLKGGRN